MKPVETRYARSGTVRIAYQAIGHGAFDLVFVPGFISNLEIHWEEPGYAKLLNRFAAFSRLIQFDKRGTGLSDRVDPGALPDLETRMDDVRAVMDATGSGRAALFGASEGAPMSILFAATYPERTRSLVLYGGYAHFRTSVMGTEALNRFIDSAEERWGTGATLKHFAPGLVDDPHFSQWWGRFERMSASPTAAVALARMNGAIDVRGILQNVRAPTLVICRKDDARVDPQASRYLADHIPGARLVEIPGRDHPVWTGDVDRVADIVEEFLTGVRPQPASRRMLSALLIARIIAPERLAARLGDRDWRELAAQFRNTAEGIAAAARRTGLRLRWRTHPVAHRRGSKGCAQRGDAARRGEGNGTERCPGHSRRRSGIRRGNGVRPCSPYRRPDRRRRRDGRHTGLVGCRRSVGGLGGAFRRTRSSCF